MIDLVENQSWRPVEMGSEVMGEFHRQVMEVIGHLGRYWSTFRDLARRSEQVLEKIGRSISVHLVLVVSGFSI